jgi:hypothetical protein
MRTIELKIYEFDELNDEVKTTLIKNLKEIKDLDNEPIREIINEYYLSEYGIKISSVYWDWNRCSEGGFIGYVQNFEKFFNKINFKEFNEMYNMSISWDIKRENMVLDECTNPIDEDTLNDLEQEDDLITLHERLKAHKINDLMNDLIRYLSKEFIDEVKDYIWKVVNDEYNYQLSEENLIEDLREFEYLYNGERWNKYLNE